MPLISSIIVDDEPGNIVTLNELIKQYCPQLIVTGTAQNPDEAIKIIKEVRPELVFLDIEMPFGNAFDLLDKLSPVNFEVIIVTAYNNYAVKAFKYAAIDYLLKPVNIAELKNAVERVTESLEKNAINNKITSFIEQYKATSTSSNKIVLPTNEGSYIENISDIMYLQASGNYTFIFCKGKEKYVVTKKLKEFEDILPLEIFIRIHNSSLININFVKKYFNGRGGYVQMEDGNTIQVASRKKNDFLNYFRH